MTANSPDSLINEVKVAVGELIRRATAQSKKNHGAMRQNALDSARLATLVATASGADDLLKRAVKFKEVSLSGMQLFATMQAEIGYLTALVKIYQLLK